MVAARAGRGAHADRAKVPGMKSSPDHSAPPRPSPPTTGSRIGAALAVVLMLGVAPRLARPQALPTELRALLASTPADSLVRPLRRYEGDHARSPEAAEAALLLGQLEYARGEYRHAAETFARAAARLDPARKPAARYHAGLAWLALGEPDQARAALEEVANGTGDSRQEALLAVAQAWELARRPDRAEETLAALLAGDPGEAGPAALERAMAIAVRDDREDQARKLRERLLARYPRSMEAAAARLATFAPADARPVAEARAGAVAVVIGSFVDPGRARSLAAAARAAGFVDARVVSHGEGLAAVHTVRLGIYPRVSEARKAGDQAAQALGVAFELTHTR
jgi:tetratricopeptide (TPR) repeat protein